MNPDDVFMQPIGEDEKVVAQLQLAAELDQPPAELGQAVKAAFSLRTLDAELAELTYDSSQDERALAGVRDAVPSDGSRFLTFEAPALVVEVEATPEGGARRLVGQLSPPAPGRLVVRHSGGTTTVDVDEFGRFSVDGIATGPISLHCETASGDASAAAVATDWVII